MIIDGTACPLSRVLPRVSIAVMSGERDGDEIGGKFRTTSILIELSPIASLIALVTAFGSLPGGSRQSTSAYAVSEITLVFWLAERTVGGVVSRTWGVWVGVE